MQPSSTYYVQVWAVNNAGITSEPVQSHELRIQEPEADLGGQDPGSAREVRGLALWQLCGNDGRSLVPAVLQALLAAIVAICIVLFVAMGLVFYILQRRCAPAAGDPLSPCWVLQVCNRRPALLCTGML